MLKILITVVKNFKPKDKIKLSNCVVCFYFSQTGNLTMIKLRLNVKKTLVTTAPTRNWWFSGKSSVPPRINFNIT